jgi:trehalose 6-phosphate synthase
VTPSGGAHPFVVVSDLLPGREPGQDTVVGTRGQPDEPVTAAFLAQLVNRGGAWVGREQAFPLGSGIPATDPINLGGGVSDYLAHCDRTIWPLFHDLVSAPAHERTWRQAYRTANLAFARTAARRAAHGATVWVHDYQLLLVPALLRELRPDLRIGFFLTTMFPAPELIRQTPMHRELMSGLRGADLIGFQSAHAAENYLRIRDDPEYNAIGSAGVMVEPASVGVYPTAVETAEIDRLVRRPDVRRRAAEIRARLGDPSVLILSIDEPSEAAGSARRLSAFSDLLADGTLRSEDVRIVQVLTRRGPDDATDVTGDVAREAARLNGQHASVGRPCVDFIVASPTLADRVALYLAANVLVATPLRAGTTPAALEFAAVGPRNSVVVLSEFSGTAGVLPEAFSVNPYDDGQFRGALRAALATAPDERRQRLASMRTYVSTYDTHAWARLFITALNSGREAPPAVLRRHRPVPAHRRPRTTGLKR